MNSLNKYNQKRNFLVTNEPRGEKKKSTKKKRFVIQHHIARKDHYDLRLEFDGVLKSWAVPKGPSYNPKDKRLAILVEEHPLSYRNFEGVIPKGQYGAGTVMLFDEGYFESLEDFETSFKKGSIKFILRGQRLKGKWSLVRYKENNWLLIKEKDSIWLYEDIKTLNTSIRSGRTMDEIAENKKIVKNSKKEGIVEGVKISSPDKLIFKKKRISKLEIALYYKKVIKRMLPFVRGRILSTVSCPGGVNDTCFFKKHLGNKSRGIEEVKLSNNKHGKEDYYYIVEASGIIAEVQRNSYEFHVWGSRVDNLEKPDILVFDLDPDERISLAKVRQGVRDLKSVLDEFNLKSFLKTSGGKGYHVLVPTKKLKSWSDLRDFAKNIAKLMEMKWPDKYVSNMRKEKRKGKIFIDWMRNTRGATSVAPYSLRARDNARVSMPIRYSELDKVKPDGIGIKEALKRLNRKDPWEGFFEVNQ